MTIALGYSRVSTREQAVGGISLDMQAQHMARYCAEHGWELSQSLVDAGYSGGKWKRPALQEMLGLIPNGKAGPRAFDAVLVYRLDRLSRRVRDVVTILDRLESADIAFVSTSEPQYNRDTPMGRAMIHVGATFAQLYRDLCSESAGDNLFDLAREGRWKGRPPYGYDCKEGVLYPNQHAEIVRLAYRLFVEEHLGCLTIARRLNLLTERHWQGETVHRMLLRPTYKGVVTFNGQEFPGKHEGLVSVEMWEAARRIGESRHTVGRAGERGLYLLSGILKCRYCGGNMIGRRGGRTAPYNYICARGPRLRCRGSYVSIAKAHRVLLLAVQDLTREGADLGPIVRLARREPDPQLESTRLKEQLARLPDREKNLLRLASHGTIAETQLKAALADLRSESGKLLRAIGLLQHPAAPDPRSVQRVFRDFADLLASDDVPMQEKKDLLASHLRAIVIHPDERVEITLLYPAT